MPASPDYSYFDLKPSAGSFLADVVAGLSARPKTLPAKYFYDERGSELFEAICELPEYYPTRTELAMLHASAPDMAARLGPHCEIVEYGSGSGRKTAVLIRALEPVSYIAIDISGEQLRRAVAALVRLFPNVRMAAVCADYSRALRLPELDAKNASRRVVYFPGSTIGNFTAAEALAFLRNARELAGPGGAMLVGVDLKKDRPLLNAAYNDKQGITAAFNLNLLRRINREIGGDFDLEAFRHHAFYNDVEGRIEMHLVSLRDQRVSVGSRMFELAEGETIHTENSYKYSVEEFQSLARNAGFAAEHSWVDPQALFSIHYLKVQTDQPESEQQLATYP
jgi:dimethylhistidine N-methyltransferase